MSQLTPAQQRAVQAEGNILVEAGAGTGKTRALVARCLARVVDAQPPIPLRDMVMVTFTEAAAAEMRKRIRAALEQACQKQPGNRWLEEQLASIDAAWISTLHGFCLSLAREHFHELGLDPQFTVLAQEQINILEQEVLDSVFVQPEHAARLAVLHRWSRERGQGGMVKLRGQVLRLYNYSQTLRDPPAWFQRQLADLDQPEPTPWIRNWPAEMDDWRAGWLDGLEPFRGQGFADCLDRLAAQPSPVSVMESGPWLEAVTELLPAKKGLPKGVQKRWEALAEELEFLRGLLSSEEGAPQTDSIGAMREDWEWTRHAMANLLQLTLAFQAEYTRRKSDLGGVDFHDLEQNALRLLWNPQTQSPGPVAETWRKRARMLLIDEYQDINEAQDAILECLGQPAEPGNRFLVGDIKQSIYRFRLANPRIFQRYARAWREPSAPGQVLGLTENFRSHPAILDFVNRFFTGLMRESVGGVDYSAATGLQSGDPDHERFKVAAPSGVAPAPRVRLDLLLQEDVDEEAGGEAAAALSQDELEARMIGQRLLGMLQAQCPVWDEAERRHRPLAWRDVAILLRSPSGKAEVFAKEFARLGIPLAATRGGFYDAIEISDWLNLLRLLDNPLQDLPLLAVLRSPLAGFTDEELVAVRLAGRAQPLWTALQILAQSGEVGAAPAKAARFAERHARWRRMTRVSALSECLALMLDETLYETWLSLQPRAAQRQANLRRLLHMARQFDQFQRQGLFRFLRFVDAQAESGAGSESPVPELTNSVRLLSIHQSKGLEFPVTVIAGLAKRFNETDLQNSLILDERLGLCPTVRAPESGRKYPSVAHWFARRRQRQEMAGEEMRLLYVAMTRARDYLILAGRASEGKLGDWSPGAGGPLSLLEIGGARSFMDWIGPQCAAMVPQGDLSAPGERDGFAWHACAPGPLRQLDDAAQFGGAGASETVEFAPEASLKTLRERLAWRYPYVAAAGEPAKTSVSAWRRRVTEGNDGEAYPLFTEASPVAQTREKDPAKPDKSRLSAAEIGTIHHRFMEWVRLDKTAGLADIESEADRMEAAGILMPGERAALDLPAVAAFWTSELGRQLCAQAPRVRRELPFTARFTPAELRGWVAGQMPAVEIGTGEDFIVVQGVVDLAVMGEREIWVVDYKTDHARPQDLPRKARAYAPQLALYATALARVYHRPATRCWLHFLSLGQSVDVSSMLNLKP